MGECHDQDGSHRSSGRIYRVVYGRGEKRSVDLQRLSDGDLVELHLHANAWFVRHARRILHERHESGRDLTAAWQRLRAMFDRDRDEIHRLRALWTLYVTEGLDEPTLVQLLQDRSLHVRRWAVRLLVDRPPPSSEAIDAMARLAHSDKAPQVRLALASSLQQLPLEDRWAIATALATHGTDARDPYLPLMLWYGVEPLVAEDGQAGLELASRARRPQLRRYIARRVLDVDSPVPEKVVRAALRSADPHLRADLLQGMLAALSDRGGLAPPPSWPALYDQITSNSDPSLRGVAVRLATIFGDRRAIGQLRRSALDSQVSSAERREALRALLQIGGGVSVAMLHQLVEEKSVVRGDAIQALSLQNEPSTAHVLISAYPHLDPAERQNAIGVLGTRRTFADALLGAIETGIVPRRDVSAFALQQLRSFRDADLQRRIRTLWSDAAEPLEKSDEIARYKRQMKPEYLSRGDARAGRAIFERTCAKCHTLFGEGGTIGPDLTGSGRKEVDYLLSNLVDPSAIVNPTYRLTTIATSDGRVLSGFMIEHTEQSVLLRTQEARVRLAMEDIEELQTSGKSMMPEGMLGSLSDQQVRDLLLYLASERQVPLALGE